MWPTGMDVHGADRANHVVFDAVVRPTVAESRAFVEAAAAREGAALGTARCASAVFGDCSQAYAPTQSVNRPTTPPMPPCSPAS